MAIEKKYVKSRDICKTTFHLSPEAAAGSTTVFLVGDFNEWSLNSLPMKRMKDGSFKLSLELKPGNVYQFRYLLDGERWENDWSADGYCYSEFGNCDNSVVHV